MKQLIKATLSGLPASILVRLLSITKGAHLGGVLANRVSRMECRLLATLPTVLDKAAKKGRVVIIRKTYYDGPIFTCAMYCDYMKLFLALLSLDCVPVVSDESAGGRVYLTYFLQTLNCVPAFQTMKIKKKYCFPKLSTIDYPIHFSMLQHIGSRTMELTRKIAKIFTILNKETRRLLEESFTVTFPQDEPILGVLLRGTDYLRLKPKGHPIQPSIDTVADCVSAKAIDEKCLVFLATEDRKCYEHFVRVCQNKVIGFFDDFPSDSYYGCAKNYLAETIADTEKHSFNYLRNLFGLLRCKSISGANSGAMLFVALNIDDVSKIDLFACGTY